MYENDFEHMTEVRLPRSLRGCTKYTLHIDIDLSGIHAVTRNRVIRALRTGVITTRSGLAYDLFVHLSNRMPYVSISQGNLLSNIHNKELFEHLEARALLVSEHANIHRYGWGMYGWHIKLSPHIVQKEVENHNILTADHRRHANEAIRLLEQGETITINKRG